MILPWLETLERIMKYLERCGDGEDQQWCRSQVRDLVKLKFESALVTRTHMDSISNNQPKQPVHSSSSLPYPIGSTYSKMDAHNTYKLHFLFFTYNCKDNFISSPMTLVGIIFFARVNGNHWNKLAFWIYLDATPYFGPLDPIPS